MFVLAGLMAVLLTQCRAVDDNVLGVRLARVEAARCIRQCAEVYNDSIRVESDLHVGLAQACGSDTVCLALEDIRHLSAVDRIQAGRKVCQNNCHHQGGGQGGS